MMQLCQVVGCGPAALGLAVAADRLGVLPELLQRGVTFLEQAPSLSRLKAARFPYDIESNSLAGDFLDALAPTGMLHRLLGGAAVARLRRSSGRTVPLSAVRELMGELTDALLGAAAGSPSGIRFATRAELVRCNADRTFTTFAADGRPIATSPMIVLATGAEENSTCLRATYGLPPDRVVHSGTVLRGDLRAVSPPVEAGGTVTIVGGSHSGFAAARLLLDRLGDRVAAGRINLVHRGITMWFRDIAQARLHECVVTGPMNECPSTGAVNRFTGLRGRARDLCIQVMTGCEPRVRLLAADTAAAHRAIAEATVVVQATGYQPVGVAFQTWRGEPIALRCDHDRFVVDGSGRLVETGGSPLDRAFGLGIGYPRVTAAGEREAAINIMHGRDSAQIVNELLRTY